MPRKRIVKTVLRRDPNRPGHTIEKEVVRKVSAKAPKQPKISQKQKTRQFLEKAGLHQTKSQRRSMEKQMERVLGYKPPKLGDLVNNPSRHTVKARQPIYEVKTKTRPGERRLLGYERRDWDFSPKYEHAPDRKIVVEKKLIGEKISIKRLSKKGQRGKGSTIGQGPVRHGSAASIRYNTKQQKKAGKRGKRPGREAKKKKKNK